MQAISIHSNCLGGQGGRFPGSFPGNIHQMLQAACPCQGAAEVRINTWEFLGSFGLGKEHKLRCFSGLVWWYLLDPTKKPIFAKGVLLYPSGPASGQYFHVDHLQGQTESQHVAQHWMAPPACDGASISCNGHLPEKNCSGQPHFGAPFLSPGPSVCSCPSCSMSVACGAMR